jgi:hypothetical protein
MSNFGVRSLGRGHVPPELQTACGSHWWPECRLIGKISAVLRQAIENIGGSTYKHLAAITAGDDGKLVRSGNPSGRKLEEVKGS